jgi:hypothetical protein
MTSAPSSFWEWMASLDSADRTGVMLFSVLALVVLATIVACAAYKMHKNRLDDARSASFWTAG